MRTGRGWVVRAGANGDQTGGDRRPRGDGYPCAVHLR